MKLKRVFILFTVLLSLNYSCKNQEEAQAKSEESEMEITNLSWQLQELNSERVKSEDYMRGLPYIVLSDSAAMSGSTGCNQFTGTYSLKETDTFFKPSAMTKMSCPGDGEMQFLEAIKKVNASVAKGDSLVLMSDEKALMKFRKNETAGKMKK
jgi:heat shock protein HslJ